MRTAISKDPILAVKKVKDGIRNSPYGQFVPLIKRMAFYSINF